MSTPTPPSQAPKPQELIGKLRAKQILQEVKETAANWAKQDFVPHMVSVLASDDEASRVYVESKAKKAASLGVRFSVHTLPVGSNQAELNALLRQLSDDDDIHGIVMQMPVFAGLDADEAMLQIASQKDIEGFTPNNIALFAAGRENEAILPPTPHAVRYLLEDALGGDLRGKHVAVIGPGRTVGRPLIFMLNNKGATVTICNEHTRHLTDVLAPADAVAISVGKAGLLKPEHVQPRHTVVDAGINVVDGRIVGDAVPDLPVSYQTPVPRGVGPLTRALMYANLIRAVRLQRKRE